MEQRGRDIRLRVLVIDDETIVREMLYDVLDALGYETESAASGSEGLDKLATRRFDVVVTDLLMPGLSGFEVIERARFIAPGAGLILLTGSATTLTQNDSRLRDVVLLHKPVRMDDLQRAVEHQRRAAAARRQSA